MPFLEEDDGTGPGPDPVEVLPDEPVPELIPPETNIGPGPTSSSGGTGSQSIVGIPSWITEALGIGGQVKATDISSGRSLEGVKYTVDEAARKFNLELAQKKIEFEKTLELELQKLGLDRERVEEAKRQFNVQTSGYMDYDATKPMPAMDLGKPFADNTQSPFGPLPPMGPVGTSPSSPSMNPMDYVPAQQSQTQDLLSPPMSDIPSNMPRSSRFNLALDQGLPVGM